MLICPGFQIISCIGFRDKVIKDFVFINLLYFFANFKRNFKQCNNKQKNNNWPTVDNKWIIVWANIVSRVPFVPEMYIQYDTLVTIKGSDIA